MWFFLKTCTDRPANKDKFQLQDSTRGKFDKDALGSSPKTNFIKFSNRQFLNSINGSGGMEINEF